MSYYASVTEQRIESLRKFQSEVRVADIKVDSEFQRILREAQALLEIDDQQVADALSVSRPTVNRWKNGRNLPYLGMRKPIATWIGEQLTAKIRKLDSAVREFAGSSASSSSSRYVAASAGSLFAKAR